MSDLSLVTTVDFVLLTYYFRSLLSVLWDLGFNHKYCAGAPLMRSLSCTVRAYALFSVLI